MSEGSQSRKQSRILQPRSSSPSGRNCLPILKVQTSKDSTRALPHIHTHKRMHNPRIMRILEPRLKCKRPIQGQSVGSKGYWRMSQGWTFIARYPLHGCSKFWTEEDHTISKYESCGVIRHNAGADGDTRFIFYFSSQSKAKSRT
jgi:hypothetical protein